MTGYVFGLACLPVNRALLDFWQADVNGAYDNTGFTFRGHQYTNAQGAFTLSTIVPGLYPGRTRHIHVKVQAPGKPILTTQLYFPNEPRNNTDTIFDARLLMTVRDNGNAKEAAFDFVLNVPQTPTTTGTPPPTTSTPPGGTTWAAGTNYAAGRPRHLQRPGLRVLTGAHGPAGLGATERPRVVADGLRLPAWGRECLGRF